MLCCLCWLLFKCRWRDELKVLLQLVSRWGASRSLGCCCERDEMGWMGLTQRRGGAKSLVEA